MLCNCVTQPSVCSPQKRLTSITQWWLKLELQTHGFKIFLDSSPFLLQGFHTSSTLFEPIYCIAPKAHSMAIGNFFPAFGCVTATFAVHAQKYAISGPCQEKGRKTLLSKWRLVGHRTRCQHVTLTGKPLDPVPTSYYYDFFPLLVPGQITVLAYVDANGVSV